MCIRTYGWVREEHELLGHHKIVTKLREIWPPSIHGEITGCKMVVYVSVSVNTVNCT